MTEEQHDAAENLQEPGLHALGRPEEIPRRSSRRTFSGLWFYVTIVPQATS